MRAKSACRECLLPTKITDRFMRIFQLSTFFLLPVLLLAAGIVVRRDLADEGHVAACADLFKDDVLRTLCLACTSQQRNLQLRLDMKLSISATVTGEVQQRCRLSLLARSIDELVCDHSP